jgi:hypothetical protein
VLLMPLTPFARTHALAGELAKAAEAYVAAKHWAEDADVSAKVDVLLRNLLVKIAGGPPS